VTNLPVTGVFVPSDFPTLTYVERGDEDYEKDLRRALSTPRSPISISGPSKTGKTALVRKIVGADNLIHIFGSQITSAADLWPTILGWMDSPVSVSETLQGTEALTPNANASVRVGLPGVAANIGGGISTTTTTSSTETATRGRDGLSRVVREIADSEFVVFLDDFHYIPRVVQDEVGQQIKSAAEVGVRFCIASVPHRSDDVVRSNHELRGRTINLDTSYWSAADLAKIGKQGFDALSLSVPDETILFLAQQACTSPQIMQSLCLELCFSLDIEEAAEVETAVNLDQKALSKVSSKASTRADFSSLLKQMHSGPRVRGTERKEFNFSDGSTGDVYRASLLALAADPPVMEFEYSDLLTRIADVCVDSRPVGGSVTEALKQIAQFAEGKHGSQRVVEWDPDAASGTFAIIDPYFLFFLRSSKLTSTLGYPESSTS
jgi:hypothetical protein